VKKIIFIAVALVMALGGLGIGYAAWTDEVTITGEVNTGTVDIQVTDYSGTWLYKDPGGPNNETWFHQGSAMVPFDPPAGSFEVAHAVALPDGDDKIKVEFVNLFPLNGGLDYWEADFVLHYAGSIPVKVEIADLAVAWDDPQLLLTLEYTIDAYELVGTEWVLLADPECKQLEYCNYIKYVIGIRVPQETSEINELNMNRSGDITGTISVIQWNESDCPQID
jgi:predicted ribosomally synthesized peptide with SipW-like signal peptide